MRSLRAQLVTSTVLLAAALMVVLVLGTQAVLELTARRDIARALEVRAEAAGTVLEQAPDARTADVEPGTRVYDASGTAVAGGLERRLSGAASALAARSLAAGAARTSEVGDYRLRAVPFTSARGERGVVVVSQATAAYERSERYAALATVALGGIVIVLVGAVAWRVSRRALAPVRQMAERAADWSEHDLDHRFDLGPPTTELAALGATLDHLLDRVARAILSEQRLTAELAHELRTPLTAIAASAELARLRPDGDPAVREDLAEIGAAADRMAQAISTLLEVARSPETARGTARAAVPDVVAAVAPLVPARLRVESDVAPGCPPVAVPADLAVRALTPLVENAARHAHSSVTLAAHVVADRVEITVRDDGGGVPVELRERLFEPGTSGSGGTGLGLGIARRVARSVGGDVVLSDDGTTGGARFVLRLPRG